ncbi:MAG: hypothetical protein CBB68_14910 [Rhodospirillaceae bacterium TMED8]|nr:hypothetical protein [Magnetovibrio sp.]OUT47721.1 MAG: hypothetical protein CBB68_14910 [Rhodospirillaceae bacterium TMED8]|tara:strand:+ start:703 stop:1206 length:504 start_codon:yes stop_codon:yes gene_type:complete
MSTLSVSPDSVNSHPIDTVEQLAEFNEWAFDRRSNEEMAVQVPGTWCDYSLYFAWNDEMEAMHFTCAFDMRVDDSRYEQVYELLAIVNERLWLGHFGMWSEENLPMFRATLPLRGRKGVTVEQAEDMVETAIFECERFYPAFQYVIWGGKTATEAVEAAMIDTVGEA